MARKVRNKGIRHRRNAGRTGAASGARGTKRGGSRDPQVLARPHRPRPLPGYTESCGEDGNCDECCTTIYDEGSCIAAQLDSNNCTTYDGQNYCYWYENSCNYGASGRKGGRARSRGRGAKPLGCCGNQSWNNGCPEHYLCSDDCSCVPGSGPAHQYTYQTGGNVECPVGTIRAADGSCIQCG